MDVRRALSLLQGAISETTGNWADLGCGEGTFTLARQSCSARRDASMRGPGYSVFVQARTTRFGTRQLIPVLARFSARRPTHRGSTGPLAGRSLRELPSLHSSSRANPASLDAQAARRRSGDPRGVRPPGGPTPGWPYPIAPARLETVAAEAGTHTAKCHGAGTVDIQRRSLCRRDDAAALAGSVCLPIHSHVQAAAHKARTADARATARNPATNAQWMADRMAADCSAGIPDGGSADANRARSASTCRWILGCQRECADPLFQLGAKDYGPSRIPRSAIERSPAGARPRCSHRTRCRRSPFRQRS
jgi:hypothetical protein